jgi:Zn-dependent membrane protease YugP
MHIVIPLLLIVLIVAVIFGPRMWAQYTFKRYASPRNDIPGNGAQLARHLLKELNINNVSVEETNKDGDHYSSTEKAVRLSPDNYHNNSLTAITVAAHEVGHAIQDHQDDPMLRRRHNLILLTHKIQQLGMWLLTATFVLGLFSRSPLIGVIAVLAGLTVMGISVVVNLVTLPVEFDASFNKALPILFKGNYIEKKDQAAAKRILKAAAYTYVAASLADLLNLARWIAILRR